MVNYIKLTNNTKSKGLKYLLIGVGTATLLLTSPNYKNQDGFSIPEIELVDFIPLYGIHTYINREGVADSFYYFVNNATKSFSKSLLEDIVTIKTSERTRNLKYSEKFVIAVQNLFMIVYHVAVSGNIILGYLNRRHKKPN